MAKTDNFTCGFVSWRLAPDHFISHNNAVILAPSGVTADRICLTPTLPLPVLMFGLSQTHSAAACCKNYGLARILDLLIQRIPQHARRCGSCCILIRALKHDTSMSGVWQDVDIVDYSNTDYALAALAAIAHARVVKECARLVIALVAFHKS